MTVIESMKARGIIPRAALYARFSSDNQREESIDAQLRAMREYCKRNKVVITNEYCDHARSATTDDRPEFQRMIRESRTSGFDLVIVHKLDRFSRDRYDSAYYKRELKKCGVSLISVLENLDDSPESIILESVLEGMSEYYSRNLAREVMKGMRESALQCRAVGGCAPFGYKINPETKRYEIEENEVDAVKMIFDKVLEGVGYSEIIYTLNAMGYLTRGGKPFGKNSLHEILRNEKYRGVYIFNRSSSKNVSGRRNNHASKTSDEMIRIEGGVPQIISEEVWNGVGNPVYPPAKKKLAEHGISCEGKRAYKMQASDYDKYDYIVVMERRHIRAIDRYIHKDTEGKVKLLLSYAGHGVDGDTSRDEVDDPWYSGDFQATWEDVNEGCRGLLEHILAK